MQVNCNRFVEKYCVIGPSAAIVEMQSDLNLGINLQTSIRLLKHMFG